IKGYADIINRSDTQKEEVEEYIHIIQEETEQLTVLIKNLFQLAKIDQNNFMINREHIELCSFIKNAVERIRPVLAKKKVMLHVNYTDEVNAFINYERFTQVLTNILSNAQKHDYEGTEIKVDVKQTAKQINITFTEEGEGIPKKDLPYIFDRLYRVEKSRSRLNGGSGLGLAISKEIVESHGGSIEVQSELGKG